MNFITRNVEGRPSKTKEMITDGNKDLGALAMVNTPVNTFLFFFFFWLFISL